MTLNQCLACSQRRKLRLDEMVVRIAGERMYLWRAVDHEGEVLDLLVQRRRDSRAALRLMRKLLKRHGFAPKLLVTDKLRSYAAAFRRLRLTCSKRSPSAYSSADRSDGARPVCSRRWAIIVLSKSPRPASASRLCRKRSASANMREYRPMAAPFVERGLADPTDHVPRPAPGQAFQGVSWSSGQNHRWRRSTKCSTRAPLRSWARRRGCSMAGGFWLRRSRPKTGCGFMP